MKQESSKILIDAHTHTSGISLCSRISAKEMIDVCINDNVDGMVLTNHYKSAQIHEPFDKWRKRYVDEYTLTKQYGTARGIKVFFGVEVTLDCMPQNDFTIYGLTEDIILGSSELYKMTFPELCDFVHSNNALIYHAHPFRNTTPVDGTMIDGTEINCHPLYGTCAENRVRAFADKFDLRLSCGSDYHGDTYKAHCGMLIPSDIDTTKDFVEYIRANKRPELIIAPDP
ncbi:MAG: hypothetical protein PUF72_09840 [Clostridiales bacterium]|nr:hypothetical protein [Clostridiales bacterium]